MEGCSEKSDYISKPSCTQELDVLVFMQSTSGLPGHWELKGKDNSSWHMCSLWPSLLGFPCDSAGRESACNVGDLGLIPGLGRSPGEGKGYPLQDSGLENSMDCTVHGVAKNRTRLSDFHFLTPLLHFHYSLHITQWLHRESTRQILVEWRVVCMDGWMDGYQHTWCTQLIFMAD